MSLSKFNSLLPLMLVSLPLPAWAEEAEITGEDPASEDPASERPGAEEDPDRVGRKMDLRVPETGPPAPRKAYVHEGFYFRAGVGPGILHTAVNNRALDSSANTAAFSVAANAMIGGSPAPGLAIGGGALAHLGLGGSFDGIKSGGIFHLNLGPFFDAFPDRKRGFHLGALVGLSTVSLSSEVSPHPMLWGGGAAAWLGWDTWVAPEWSVGVQLQTGGSYATAPDVGASIFHANVLVTLLQH